MSKCEICGGSGYHKLSCGNNTARVAIPMDIVIEEQEKKYLNGIIDQIEKLTPSDYEVMPEETVCALNAFIPTLTGDEAEEFIRKAESAERATVDWSKQMKQMELALNKSRIANRKLRYAKGATPTVKRNKDVEE